MRASAERKAVNLQRSRLTDEVVPNPTQRHFALEFGMPQHLATDRVCTSVGNHDLA